MSLEQFGKYIQDLRIKGGLGSQRALAEKLGMSNSTLARVESGTHDPSDETLHKLADAFGVDYLELSEKRYSANRTGEEALVDKLRKLNRQQLTIVQSIVDEFLGKSYRDKSNEIK
jgi:transcriptional regulator with XRE-family HTH domain